MPAVGCRSPDAARRDLRSEHGLHPGSLPSRDARQPGGEGSVVSTHGKPWSAITFLRARLPRTCSTRGTPTTNTVRSRRRRRSARFIRLRRASRSHTLIMRYTDRTESSPVTRIVRSPARAHLGVQRPTAAATNPVSGVIHEDPRLMRHRHACRNRLPRRQTGMRSLRWILVVIAALGLHRLIMPRVLAAESRVDLGNGLNGAWRTPGSDWNGRALLLFHGFADDMDGAGDLQTVDWVRRVL